MAQLAHALRLAARRSPLAPALRRVFRPGRLEGVLARGRRDGWEAAARWLLSEAGGPTLATPEFHAALRGAISVDIETELLLTAVRREIALTGLDPRGKPELQAAFVSLVRQCINNEYVWRASDEEREAIGAALAADGSTRWPTSWDTVARAAMYVRLERLLAGVGRKDRAIAWPGGAPAEWEEVVTNYLADHYEEMRYRESVPSFGAINRAASKVVGANYEEYPYPRWLDWKMPAPGQRPAWLADFYAPEELAFLERPFRMLVAGCGTGAKAVSYAICHGENAQILAIDLSRASLAYAMRMARRYGVRNIEFLRMDLLDLPRLGRQFEMVESTGVLHHLKDPLEGGRALVGVLKEGGIAHISLYSELSRREVVRLRGLHGAAGREASDDEVREFRWRLMQDDPASIEERLPLRWDFFDLNRCRDLLFHPLEHRFTLPQVERFLEGLGLEFRGLWRPPLSPNRYWTRFPPSSERRNLERWHAFELAYPEAFGNLYEICSLKRTLP